VTEPEARRELLAIARRAIELAVSGQDDVELVAEGGPLAELGSSFVTLTLEGRLRGCIGSLSFDRPLVDDVRENAVAAAVRDLRFPAVEANEVAQLRIEVSLLSPPHPLPAVETLEEAAASLRPGLDGVVLERGWARGVFLPQVWESLAEPREFLRQLRRKAGLEADGWDSATRLWRFEVEKLRE
jgi:AmmeMemoRadiSam system protein A